MTLNKTKEFDSETICNLRTKSLQARELSYCPYSKFRVGCVVLTENNEWISGANVENASYPAGICAERVALSKTMTTGKGLLSLKAIAIATDSEDSVSPCGICRQFIREFSKDVPIFMFNKNGKYIKMSLEELLPKSFGPENLF